MEGRALARTVPAMDGGKVSRRAAAAGLSSEADSGGRRQPLSPERLHQPVQRRHGRLVPRARPRRQLMRDAGEVAQAARGDQMAARQGNAGTRLDVPSDSRGRV
jgi:hypothetical protein